MALALLLVPSGAHARAPVLPDLVPDRAEHVRFSIEQPPTASLPHLLLRFDAFVHNAGAGPLELRGTNPQEQNGRIEMTDVVQRVYFGASPDDPFRDISSDSPPTIFFEASTEHNHFHLLDAVDYLLVGRDHLSSSSFAKSQLGFCLQDAERVTAPLASGFYDTSSTNFCQQRDPLAQTVVMGISPGWRDVYTSDLDYQWVDASILPPGEYDLVAHADPSGVILESNEANNADDPATEVPVTIPGYVAQSTYVRATRNIPQPIGLEARRYESDVDGAEPPGPAEFRIVDAPVHGTVSQPIGEWLRGGHLVYLPGPGYSGRDSFTYEARDEDHPYFPRFPRAATVAIQVSPLPG